MSLTYSQKNRQCFMITHFSAGENIVVFDLNCQRGVDRAEDMYALFPLYYTYIGAGCLENDDNLTSLPPGQVVSMVIPV